VSQPETLRSKGGRESNPPYRPSFFVLAPQLEPTPSQGCDKTGPPGPLAYPSYVYAGPDIKNFMHISLRSASGFGPGSC